MRKVKSLFSHTIEIIVPFYDVDSMFVVWHGHYLKYFEDAREALLKELGFGYREMFESSYLFPVVESQAKYIRSLQFEDQCTVTAYLIEYENRIRIRYQLFNSNNEKVCVGETTQVAVERGSNGLSFVMPDQFIASIEEKLKSS